MSTEKMRKLKKLQGRILWIEPTPFDVPLYKASSSEILWHIEKKGYSLVLVTTRSRKVIQDVNPNVRVIFVPLRFAPLLSSAMFAIGLFIFLPFHIIFSKPDFVIITQPEASILSFIPWLPFFRKMKMKFILDVRSIPVETVGLRGFQQKLWFNISILVAKRLFDGITIITPLMRNEICNTFEIDSSKVGTWSAGVNTELFNPKDYISEGIKLRSKLGLSGKFVVFYHGVFTATRGLKETVESIKMLKFDHPDLVLFLLGTGPAVSILKHLVLRENLEENVIIHDPVDYAQVPKFIEMSDVCIVPLPDHPYWRFQCPLKLLEYLAMEKVVILTDIPAHRSVVGKEECGIFVSAAKPIEIAKAIEHCYLNKESLREWGKVGRKIVTERYTWEKVARDLHNYLLSIDYKADYV